MKKERFEIINDLRSKGLNVNDSDWKDYEHYLSEIKLNDDTTELLKKGKNKYLDYLRCVVSDDVDDLISIKPDMISNSNSFDKEL